jgi:hypothetical protein
MEVTQAKREAMRVVQNEWNLVDLRREFSVIGIFCSVD